MTLYDMAMNGITSYSKFFLRIATFVGVGMFLAGLLLLIPYFVFLGIQWNGVHPSVFYPILDVILMVGGVILFFLGILGEYVLQINTRVLKRPFVIEEERINF